jgi:hypothetical protein
VFSVTDLCTRLYRDPNHEGWNDFDMLKLPLSDLEFLSRMMGIPHSGTKEKRIVRLLSCRIVRKALAHFGDDPADVVPAFKRERLKWMCQQANLWKSGNKYGLSVVLLRWRNQCRLDGSEYLKACIAFGMEQPVQLPLPL